MHPWKSLREESARHLHQPKAKEELSRIRAANESLSRFSCADDLFQFLHDRAAGDAEEKNVILGALIRCAHHDPSLLSTIRALLFVALFPALDRVFNSLLPLVPNTRAPEARLTNDIFWAFHLEIETWDFKARSRVAATLQLNVRRKVKKRYVNETAASENSVGPADSNIPGTETFLKHPEASEKKNAAPDIQKLKESLGAHPALKEGDLDLILGRFARGDTFAHLAQQLGITEENARQRFRRALVRLRSTKNSVF